MDLMGPKDNLPEDLKEMHDKITTGFAGGNIKELLATVEKTLKMVNDQLEESNES